MTLYSFVPSPAAVIIGAEGGIGGALADALAAEGARLGLIARSVPTRSAAYVAAADLMDETALGAAAEGASNALGPLDLVIVSTGALKAPEKSWRDLDAGALAEAYAKNAIGPALAAKHFLPLLRKDGKAVFAALSARVGSISDNHLGGWHGYRASKAALNMLIRTLSIEFARKRPEAVALALHPGTVDTDLSRPFRPKTAVPPAEAAANLLSVIDRTTASDTGKLLAWDGSDIPY
ncbi:MAG: SDR family NAD(P)-dependent oxidoreductase [Pseudomonadota bacterium]